MKALDRVLTDDPTVADGRLRRVIELFAVSNLAFLALDVYLAHLENHFRHPAEWVPVVFSAAAPLLMVPYLVARKRAASRWLWLGTAVASIAVGIAGVVFHLSNTFFLQRTLKSLVYTAPFVAPLAYTGIGLLAMAGPLERSPREWSRWVVLLAAGGFIGNFVLSLADHAINGFFHTTEWVPVIAAALAVGFLVLVVVAPWDRPLRTSAAAVMGLQIAVGVVGFVLHVASPVHGWGTEHQSLVAGAPIFAPLLFADLATLGLVGLLALDRAAAPGSVAAAAEPRASETRLG